MKGEDFNGFVRARRVQRPGKDDGLVYTVAIPIALALRMGLKAGMPVKVTLEV